MKTLRPGSRSAVPASGDSSPLAALLALSMLTSTMALAQPDYPPAHWVPPVGCDKWYTTGNGHSFCVIHDMEGYYWSSISYLNRCDISASVHFLANGLQNGSDTLGHRENRPGDPAAGDITQSVREQHYSWHATCWNRYMFGTEHEGFVSSPVWYSEEMYQASAALHRHLCDTYGIPKDRNHIIGHDEKKNAGWVSWMKANWPAIDPSCNTHTDPGQYWDWNHFMSLITGVAPVITSQPQSLTVNPGSNVTFTVTTTGNPAPAYQWLFNAARIAGATDTNYTRPNARAADAGSYSVIVTNQAGSVTSAIAVLTVTVPPTITAQPQDQLATAGRPAVFIVAAIGSAPLSYQWQFGGSDIPGATGSSYTVASAGAANMGSYCTRVSNGAGSALSSNALLVVAQDAAWGDNSQGQSDRFPGATNLIAVAAGAWFSVGLRADGSVAAWGDNYDGQCDVPPELTNVLAIAAGSYHALAIRGDGTVAGWGANDYGQNDAPAGLDNVIAIAAGTWHSLALRADGSVKAWGDNSLRQASVPAGLGNVIAIAAGGNHSLALKADGTVVAWGENTDAEGNVAGQSVVPAGLTNGVAIGAGEYHSLAVRKDGSILAWGDNSQNQCNAPKAAPSFVAVAGGGAHSLALASDGTISAWGSDMNGQCAIPPGLSRGAGIAAGEYHTLVLLPGSAPVPRLLNAGRKAGRFTALAQTLSCGQYVLEYKDLLSATNWSSLPAVPGNGALRVLADPAATASQRFYRMRQW